MVIQVCEQNKINTTLPSRQQRLVSRQGMYTDGSVSRSSKEYFKPKTQTIYHFGNIDQHRIGPRNTKQIVV